MRPSPAIAELVSNVSVFTAVTGTGVPKARVAASRFATQMSPPPVPPCRSVVKTISSKSLVSVGLSERMPDASSVTNVGGSKWYRSLLPRRTVLPSEQADSVSADIIVKIVAKIVVNINANGAHATNAMLATGRMRRC